MANVEDYIKEDTLKEAPNEDLKDNSESTDIEEKRESLAILATLGTSKDFTGVDISLGDVKKLSSKDVNKYFNRYKKVLGKQVTGGLVESAISAASHIISYAIPIDDVESLITDLKNDDLVKRELSDFAGLLVMKGGRFVALASGLFKVVKHVKLTSSVEKGDTIHEIITTDSESCKDS